MHRVPLPGPLHQVFKGHAELIGHLLECSTQVTGGLSTDWMDVPNPEDIGNPVCECRADGSLPISDVYTHHRTMTACHLCNIALMLKRELSWNPKLERFIGDDEANQLLSRPSRPGFTA